MRGKGWEDRALNRVLEDGGYHLQGGRGASRGGPRARSSLSLSAGRGADSDIGQQSVRFFATGPLRAFGRGPTGPKPLAAAARGQQDRARPAFKKGARAFDGSDATRLHAGGSPPRCFPVCRWSSRRRPLAASERTRDSGIGAMQEPLSLGRVTGNGAPGPTSNCRFGCSGGPASWRGLLSV